MIHAVKNGDRYELKYIGTDLSSFLKIMINIPTKKRNFTTKCWTVEEKDLEILQQHMQVVFDIPHDINVNNEIGNTLKLKPFPYQKEAIQFALEKKNALLVLPCGAGKTPIMLGVYNELKINNKIKGKGLIVVKASIKYQWLSEVSKFTDYKARVLLNERESTLNIQNRIKSRQKKIKALEENKALNKLKIKQLKEEVKQLKKEKQECFNSQFEDVDLLILNYETLKDKKVQEKLLSIDLDAVFADEIHSIKSRISDRSKALYKFNHIEYKIGATATPVGKNPEDLFGIFSFIEPKMFPEWKVFKTMYIRFAGYKPIGFKNLYQLRGIIHTNTFVKNLEDIADQLPTIITIEKLCKMNPAQYSVNLRIMNELEELKKKEFSIKQTVATSEELEQIEARILALQTFAQEIANAPELLLQSTSDMAKRYTCGTASSKIDLFLELLEEILASGEKVAVFSKFEKLQAILIKAIQSKFTDIDIACVSGPMNAFKRTLQIEKFKKKDECKVLLLSDAGAEGKHNCLLKTS